jgi:hypothetical protein
VMSYRWRSATLIGWQGSPISATNSRRHIDPNGNRCELIAFDSADYAA